MKIFELEIPILRYSQFFKEVTKHLKSKKTSQCHIICTPNPEICLKTLEDKEFLKLLKRSDYLTSDGIGLYLAYQIIDSKFGRFGTLLLFPKYLLKVMFLKTSLYETYWDRICGSDITSDLLYFCEQKQIHIAILDPYYPDDEAKCETQKNFNKKLKKHFPKLLFDMYVYDENKKEKILNKISVSDAKILFSTLGMKRQEQSLFDAKKVCPNIKLALGVGSSFDYYTWFQKRAPYIWRQWGIEWLYRIFTSPNKIKRLGRIYQAVVVFPVKVLLYKK